MAESKDHQKKLEYKCIYTHLSIPYTHGSVLWPDTSSRFEVELGPLQLGYFTIWIDDVDPDSLRICKIEIMQRTQSFALAMQYLGNTGLTATEETLFYFSEKGEAHKIVADCDIEAIIRRARGETYNYINGILPMLTGSAFGHSSPVPLPQNMPMIPLVLKRHILNVLQAEALDIKSEHYADEQLKRWFLIIEELHPTKCDQSFKYLKSARDFVSHSKLDRDKSVANIKLELPSSVYNLPNGKEEASYDRNDPQHQAFVSKYEGIARQWAKMLIEKTIASNGGHIRP